MDRYLGTAATDTSRPADITNRPGFEASLFGYSAIGAVLAAAIALSPATGDVSATVIIAGGASLALSLVEQSRGRARRGPRRLTGRRSVLLLVSLGVIVATGVSASFAATVARRGEWALAVAIVVGVLVFIGAWLSEQDADTTTP